MKNIKAKNGRTLKQMLTVFYCPYKIFFYSFKQIVLWFQHFNLYLSKNAFKVSKQAIKEFYIETLKLEPKKLLIDYDIKEIRVYEDKLEIIFNSQ